MKCLVLPALAAVLAATAHADNAPVGTPVAMPADIADILARNTTTPSRDERFASAEAAVLYQAASKGDLAAARQFAARRPELLQSHNTREMTLLGVAMDSGDHKTFNHLLDLGADPAWLGDMRDTDLHHAAKLADSAWLRALLKHSANPNVPNRLGETPLFVAPGPDTRDNFDLLLNAGADIHARASDGSTLLHAAAAINDFTAVPRLLKLGIDPTVRNRLGYTFQYSFFDTREDLLNSEAKTARQQVSAWLDAHHIPLETP